jgi:hypothetical protein
MKRLKDKEIEKQKNKRKEDHAVERPGMKERTIILASFQSVARVLHFVKM